MPQMRAAQLLCRVVILARALRARCRLHMLAAAIRRLRVIIFCFMPCYCRRHTPCYFFRYALPLAFHMLCFTRDMPRFFRACFDMFAAMPLLPFLLLLRVTILFIMPPRRCCRHVCYAYMMLPREMTRDIDTI